jgi:hypothetical protein
MTSNPYDQASRYLTKKNPVGILGWLLGRSIPFPGEPDRVCETVAHLVDSRRTEAHWAVPIEFQLKPLGSMFGRLLEYVARLWLELGPTFHVGAAVVNLTGRGNSSHSMALAGTALRTALQAAEKNLGDEDAKVTLQAIAAGVWDRCLLPWIPLMRGGDDASIIAQWKVLALAEPDVARRADFVGLALVFAEPAGCKPLWRQELMGWNMETSEQVLEWQAEALEKGLAQGKAEGKAEDLLKALRVRLGKKLPRKLQQTVLQTTDLHKLEQWFELALTAASLEAFRKATKL